MTTDAGHSLHQITSGPKPTSPINEPMDTLPEVRYSDLGDLKPIEEDEIPNEPSVPADGDLDTPQRPDSPTFGLNGFIRSHLRQVSDQSSICPPPSPGLTQTESTSNYLTTGEATSELSTPATTPDEALLGLDHTTPTSPKPSSHHSSEHTANRSSGDSSNTSAANGVEYVHSNVSNWKDELQYGHRRGASTETQREREEFEIELAERRRKVQEKLRSVAESESRSTSPAPGRSTPDIGGIKAGNAFSILKHKAAKQGMGKADLKGMMYGNNAGSTPALVSEDQWREEDRPGPNFGRHPNFSSPHVGSERAFRSRVPTVGRPSHEESRESSRSRGPSPHSGFRSRSGSDASGRSKSRTRYRERDDLETVNEAGSLPSETFVIPENYRPPLVPSSTRTSEDAEAMTYDRSTSAASGRYRSTSRSGAPGFQFERPFAYQQTQTSSMIGAPPRPPPAAPAYSANATPPLVEDQSPAGNPTATVSSAHSLSQRTPGSTLLQKRSVNKKLISEPTLVSSTSNVPLVGLPVSNSTPSVSSQQGATPPPLPPMNPRRRRGTQTILSAFKSDKHDSRASSPVPSAFDEQSSFPDDEKRPRSRNRLRKSTSETGSLHARARQEVTDVPVPALPSNPPPPIPVNGGMF
ncbi:hypothetical protein N7539_005142 [Penicillium diatomitis]|uniref:Uncharacterized protein n=1 Tax=Penicillium diatomitis TaxID=2819901 RepID=A0A9W9X6B0_9EURO|nr:uncharacterized protein N7539_005142 [Penicillium diatomitis]KAJ5485154.1 hypothetical protein N7539_005142 [Penicillium diatomitis]